MVIGFFGEIPVGCQLIGTIYHHGEYHRDTPFVVLREATYDEWLVDAGQCSSPEQLAMARDPQSRFYEISVD